MSRLIRNEEGFTGLEAAIVLIAFVVVAAVFSYVMLGAGFFATGEAQRTVHTGVSQATSNLEVSGPVVVKATGTNNLSEISFLLQLAAGGAPVDMEKVTFTVSTANKMAIFTYENVSKEWYLDGVEQTTSSTPPKNDMLDTFEMVKITINGSTTLPLPEIGPNDPFTVEVKPDIGAALPINRIAPPDLQAGYYYEVY